MANKMTNVVALTAAIETLSSIEGFDAEAIQKLENIKASYVKKGQYKGGERKPTANQVANEALKAEILSVMEPKTQYTVSVIAKALEGDYSSQKVGALIRQLVAEGKVVREEIKRQAFFGLAE